MKTIFSAIVLLYLTVPEPGLAQVRRAKPSTPARTLDDVRSFFVARIGVIGADPRFFGVNAQSTVTAVEGSGCELSLTTPSDRYTISFGDISAVEMQWDPEGGLSLRGPVRTTSGRSWPQLSLQLDSIALARRGKVALDWARARCARRGGF